MNKTNCLLKKNFIIPYFRQIYGKNRASLEQPIQRKMNGIQNKLFIEKKFYQKLIQTDIWIESIVNGTTYSTENEWNTKPIIERAWQDGKQIAIPKSNHQSKEMKFYELNHFDDLIVGDYNIKEPKKNNQMIDKEIIDILIVHGVVYNSSGYRIGFSG